MNKQKIYLGRFQGEELWIEKHSWDYGWYWSFGYTGNKNLHTHFDFTFLRNEIVTSNKFETINFNDKDWWIILDLFKQAYGLNAAAEIYRYGGNLAYSPETKFIQDAEIVKRLNCDLEKVLNKVWEILETRNLGQRK